MRLAGRPVMKKLWTVSPERHHKEVEDDHCETFLCVAGKSESFTSFSGDRFLLYDTIFDFRQLCLNRWSWNFIKRCKLVLLSLDSDVQFIVIWGSTNGFAFSIMTTCLLHSSRSVVKTINHILHPSRCG